MWHSLTGRTAVYILMNLQLTLKQYRICTELKET